RGSMVRKPAVAGAFYPDSAPELRAFIKAALEEAKVDNAAISGASSFVAPHAGYIYSGKVAAYAYKALEAADKARRFDSFVIIGPNHTGYGNPISLSAEDWETPFGVVENDIELSRAIASKRQIAIDESAHAYEHSVEVQLPFLQHVVKRPRCVFICMGDQSMDSAALLSKAILDAARALGRNFALIASSDFNHYESADVARKKDLPAIEALEKIDYAGFNKLLRNSNDTACGYGPITVAAMTARARGANKGYLLKYANSGDYNKDYSSVVAYAAIAFAP
ncbi:MAG: MEMO1 family protein, partial [Candidatus Micrarchaeia archaeon]